MDLGSFKQVAVKAAEKGARILQARYGNISRVRKKMAQEIVTEADTESEKEIFDPVITRYGNCLKAAQGIRRLGSAALDLCYVACGRFEGFWEQNLKPWDTAAGALIAAEAGGQVTTFSNQPYSGDQDEILATNGHIHKEMLKLLKI